MNKKNPILRLIEYIKKQYKLFIPAVILVFITAVLSVAPVAIIDMITRILDKSAQTTVNTGSQSITGGVGIDIYELIKNLFNISTDMEFFTVLIILGFSVGILKFLSFYLSSFLVDYTGRRIIFNIRNDIHDTILKLPIRFFESERLGKIVSIINNDVIIIQDFAGQIIMTFIKELFSVIFILIYMIFINPVLTLSLFIIGPVALLMIGIIGRVINRVEKDIRKKFSDISSIIFETLNNIPAVKVYATEELEHNRFIKEGRRYLKKEKKFLSVKTINTPFLETAGFFAILGILAVGGYQILNGGLVLGELVTFSASLALLSAPINNVSKGFIYIRQAQASAERIFNLIDEEKETDNTSNLPNIEDIKGDVVFNKVSFAYDKDLYEKGDDSLYTLRNIDFKAPKNSMVAIAGTSGSGKTTIVKLIPLLMRSYLGDILIDGKDIRKYNLKSIRKQISFVTQDIYMFHGTIADNIRYGDDSVSDTDIINASKTANAYDFIIKLPKGFDTQVGEKGVMLSGGQKQRIALARAIVKKPRILILDEATSSLDAESEKAIQDAFKHIAHKQTTIVIAHRLSTIINSDIIYLMDKGMISDSGTHKELLSRNALYKRLYELQFRD